MLFALPAAWLLALFSDLQIEREGLEEEEAKTRIYEALKVIVQRYNDGQVEIDDQMSELRNLDPQSPEARRALSWLSQILGAEPLGVGHSRFAVRVPAHAGPRGGVPGFVLKIARSSRGDYGNKQEIALWRHAVRHASTDPMAAVLSRHLVPPLLHALSYSWVVFEEVTPVDRTDRDWPPWRDTDMDDIQVLSQLKEAGLMDLHEQNMTYVGGALKVLDYACQVHPADAWVREELGVMRKEFQALLTAAAPGDLLRRYGAV